MNNKVMTTEQYIRGVENFGKVQEDFSSKEIVEKYPYFLMGRLLQAMHEKSEDKTILALLHPDRAKLASVLYAKMTIKKEKELPKTSVVIEEKAKKKDPMQILQKRLREIEDNKKEEQEEEIGEDTELLFEPQASVSLDELVEKFNNLPPSITPIWDNFNDEHLYRDLGKYSSMERMNIISETLADIYISQKLFDKAIKIYQELSLKYPEKSVIFASSIENLRNRIKES